MGYIINIHGSLCAGSHGICVHKILIIIWDDVLWITVRIMKLLTKFLRIICKHVHLGNPKNKIDNYSVFFYLFECLFLCLLFMTYPKIGLCKKILLLKWPLLTFQWVTFRPFVVCLAVANYMFAQLHPMWQINHSFRDKRNILHTNNHGIENR